MLGARIGECRAPLGAGAHAPRRAVPQGGRGRQRHRTPAHGAATCCARRAPRHPASCCSPPARNARSPTRHDRRWRPPACRRGWYRSPAGRGSMSRALLSRRRAGRCRYGADRGRGGKPLRLGALRGPRRRHRRMRGFGRLCACQGPLRPLRHHGRRRGRGGQGAAVERSRRARAAPAGTALGRHGG